MQQGLNPGHIVEALTTISHRSAQPQQIHIANTYLSNCQIDPQFPLLLLQIYSQTDNPQLQLSTLLLFSNVIKRNWSNRGKGVQKTPMNKEHIKTGIMKACLLHNMQYYKHFNALLKTMTRHCYPSNYAELHQFVLNSLQNMTEMAEKQPQNFVSHNFAAPVLSMLKTVIKQYSNKHDFKKYIAPIVGKALALSQAMQPLLTEALQSNQTDKIVTILQFLRKADKIALYALLTMPSSYQSESEISDMVKSIIVKLKEYDDTLALVLNSNVRDQIQKYLIGILQLVTKGQNTFPFIFTPFLKQYLALLINMVLVQIPEGRYRNEKLLSVVILANLKPINIYPYYTKPEDFRASIYCRKSPNSNNNDKQSHCHAVFKETYTPEMIRNMLIKLISEVMTLQAIQEGQKVELDELILEDVEIAIVDQVSEPTAYDNCLNLVKMIIKNFKDESKPVLIAMFQELNSLKDQGPKGNHIIGNLLDILLFLPVVMPESQLPLEEVQVMLALMYEQKNYKYLARVVRKYFSYFDTKIQNKCLDLLVQIVSAPINDLNSSEVVYQAALALKTVLAETYQFDGISSSILTPCIANILTIMKNKQFVTNPTLLWPIINLIIKLLSSLSDSNALENIAVMIVNGVSQLLASPKNEELITCALSQLLACLMHYVFVRFKDECVMAGVQHQPKGAQKVSPQTFVLFDGAFILVRMNLQNTALQNYDNIYRLWLCLLRHYPTYLQQQLYNFDLKRLNGQLKQLFQMNHQQVMQDSSVLFLQILEQMFLLDLIPISQEQLTELVVKHLNQDDKEMQRIRIVLECTSLYLTYAITKGHIPNLLLYFLKEIMAYKNKVSPPINSLRCFLYLTLSHYLLTTNANDAYHLFSSPFGGNFVQWFEPFLSSMQYISSKEVSKINAAGVIKAMREIGVSNYGHMLLTSREGQYPMDSLLRVITAKLDAIPEPSKYHQENMYINIIPHDMTPSLGLVKMKKIRLQFQNPLIKQILEQDLRPAVKQTFGSLLTGLDWGSDDLQERVGYGTAVSISNLLGWEIPNLSLH